LGACTIENKRGDEMVTVTASARQLLKMIGDEIDDPGFILRLTYDTSSQFAFMTDKERDGDQIVEHRGDTVLLIESELSNAFDGATIDCDEGDEGPCLTIFM